MCRGNEELRTDTINNVPQQFWGHFDSANIRFCMRSEKDASSNCILEDIFGIGRRIWKFDKVGAFIVFQFNINHLLRINTHCSLVAEFVCPCLCTCSTGSSCACKSKTIRRCGAGVFDNGLELISGGLRTIEALRWDHNRSIVNSYTWANKRPSHTFSDLVLGCCNRGLLIHNVGLSPISTKLSDPDSRQYADKCQFCNPIYGPIGAALVVVVVIITATLAHERGLGLVSITIAPASGPLSVFIGVELDRAFFSENASASFGSACISATTYGRAEDVGIARLLYRNSNSAT